MHAFVGREVDDARRRGERGHRFDDMDVGAEDGQNAAVVDGICMDVEHPTLFTLGRVDEAREASVVCSFGDVRHDQKLDLSLHLLVVTVVAMSGYGFSVEVPEGYDEAVLRARLALRGEGFSILSEMHVGGLLGPEAGTERQYLFMGVWNAAVNQRRLDHELQVAVHLPCNMVVQETGSSAMVAALDPADTVEDVDAASAAVVDEARAALGRVLDKVRVPGPD